MALHLPVLQVVIPLLAAGVALLVRHPRASWFVAASVSLVSFLTACSLFGQVSEMGTVSYAIGRWDPPWGIEYRVDMLGSLILLLITGIATVAAPYALLSVEKEVPRDRIPFYYAAWLLALSGLAGILVTGDLFNVFVFLEISSLSGYTMIAMGSDRRAVSSAFRYLIMGTIGATFIVIGIGYLYVMTGSLNMADLATLLPQVVDKRPIVVGFAFMAVGVALKLALFPLHLWLPNAYTYAPSASSVFIAATYTKVSVFMLLRFCFTVFGEPFAFETVELGMVLLPLAAVGILSMSLVAVFQRDLKRMLAYSSVAQIGYMILGISIGSEEGTRAAIVHMFNHGLMKGALFMAVGCMVYRIGSSRIDDLAGVGRRMPFTTAAFVAGGLSIIGVPLTVGLISKWYLVLAAIERGWWVAVAVVLIGSLLAVAYIWRVIEVAYLTPPPEGATREEAPLALLIPTWALVLANFYFGIDANLTGGAAGRAAAALFAGN